jgi:hypothetical protein
MKVAPWILRAQPNSRAEVRVEATPECLTAQPELGQPPFGVSIHRREIERRRLIDIDDAGEGDVRDAGGPGGVNHVRVVAHHVAPIAVARD